jgi:hypothetical protein
LLRVACGGHHWHSNATAILTRPQTNGSRSRHPPESWYR